MLFTPSGLDASTIATPNKHSSHTYNVLHLRWIDADLIPTWRDGLNENHLQLNGAMQQTLESARVGGAKFLYAGVTSIPRVVFKNLNRGYYQGMDADDEVIKFTIEVSRDTLVVGSSDRGMSCAISSAC